MIEIQPADYSACEDQEARFNVVVTGNGPISYQWSKNGSQIAALQCWGAGVERAPVFRPEMNRTPPYAMNLNIL